MCPAQAACWSPSSLLPGQYHPEPRCLVRFLRARWLRAHIRLDTGGLLERRLSSTMTVSYFVTQGVGVATLESYLRDMMGLYSTKPGVVSVVECGRVGGDELGRVVVLMRELQAQARCASAMQLAWHRPNNVQPNITLYLTLAYDKDNSSVCVIQHVGHTGPTACSSAASASRLDRAQSAIR